jgi:signal transduction protein with GAF and PtsI domain
LRALGEVTQAVNSTLDLETVLNAIVTKATQLAGTEAGAIYVYDEATREYRLRATYGMSDELIAGIKDLHIDISNAVGEMTESRTPVQVADLRNEPRSPGNDLAMEAGYRARLLVPLVAPSGVMAHLLFAARAGRVSQEHGRSDANVRYAVGGDQNALKNRQLEVASQHKSQFLANMSHELRTHSMRFWDTLS